MALGAINALGQAAARAAQQQARVSRPYGAAPQKPKPKKKKIVAPLPTNPLAPWTYGQIQSETDRRLKEQFGPQEALTTQATQARIAAIQGAAKAAAAALAGQPGAIQGIYDQANKEVQSIAGGYSQEMRDKIGAAQSAQASFAKSQGTPYSPAVDATAAGDVAFHLGGAIPGSDLASQGAAAASTAATLPGITEAAAAQEVNAAARQGEQALLDLAAKRPEMRTQILDELYKREQDKLNLRLQGRQVKVQEEAQSLYGAQFGETVAHHRATEAAATTRTKAQIKRDAATQRRSDRDYKLKVQKYQTDLDKAAAEGRQPDAAKSKVYGYIVDKNGRPILGPRGNRINVAKSPNAKAAAKGKGTAAERHPYQTAVRGAGDDLQKQKSGTAKGRNFKEEVTYLMNAYGLSRKRARQAAIAGGWKPTGTPGNPRPNQPLYG